MSDRVLFLRFFVLSRFSLSLFMLCCRFKRIKMKIIQFVNDI